MMNDDKKITNPDGPKSDLEQRRRLLKRGLLLVPALVTLRAQPAMAQAGQTITQSYGYRAYDLTNEENILPLYYDEAEARSADIQPD